MEKSKSLDKRLLINTLLLLLTFIVLLNLFLAYELNQSVTEGLKQDLLSPILPAFEVVTIEDNTCLDCFNVTQVIDQIRVMNINVTGYRVLEYNTEDGNTLILKYNVTTLPSVLLLSKDSISNSFSLAGFRRVDDALVLLAVRPVYIDVATHKQVGHIDITILSSSVSCPDCFNISSVLDQIKSIAAVRNVRVQSSSASLVMQLYNITKLPTMILSSDTRVYEVLAKAWSDIGTVEQDGSYVVRNIPPPYIDAKTKHIIGRIKLTYLSDSSCKRCYNVTLHKSVLAQVGVVPFAEQFVDVGSNEGKALVSEYSIEAVPTVVISKDAQEYKLFTTVWDQVGTHEQDGSYVFRNMAALGGVGYKNMTSGQMVNVSTQAS